MEPKLAPHITEIITNEGLNPVSANDLIERTKKARRGLNMVLAIEYAVIVALLCLVGLWYVAIFAALVVAMIMQRKTRRHKQMLSDYSQIDYIWVKKGLTAPKVIFVSKGDKVGAMTGAMRAKLTLAPEYDDIEWGEPDKILKVYKDGATTTYELKRSGLTKI